MVHKIRVDHVLQIPSSVVWQKDVYGLGAWVGLVGGYRVVDCMDDVRVRREEGVCFNFFEGLRNRLLPEGATDLFEGV